MEKQTADFRDVITDFSKAFDFIPQERIIAKL